MSAGASWGPPLDTSVAGPASPSPGASAFVASMASAVASVNAVALVASLESGPAPASRTRPPPSSPESAETARRPFAPPHPAKSAITTMGPALRTVLSSSSMPSDAHVRRRACETWLTVAVHAAHFALGAGRAASPPAVDVGFHAVERVIGAWVGDANERDRVAGLRRAVAVDVARVSVRAGDTQGAATIDPCFVAVGSEVFAVVPDALVRQVLAKAPPVRHDAPRRRGAAVGV